MIAINLNEIINEDLLTQSNIFLLKWSNENNWPVTYISNSINLLGYNKEDFYSGNIKYEDIIYSKDLEKVKSEVEYNLAKNINLFKQVYSIISKNNEKVIVEDTTIVKRNENNEIIELIGLIKNITETEIIKKEILHKREFFKHVINELNLGIKVFNKLHKPIFKNHVFEKLDIGEINELKIEGVIKNFLKRYIEEKTLDKDNVIDRFQVYNKNLTFEILISYYMIHNDLFIIESIKDITDIVEIQNKLLNLEKIDHLTQLPNKRMLNEDINTLIKEDEKFILMSLDFEKFKDINELYGIEKGDSFMVAFKEQIDLKLAKKAFVYRVFGDNFNIIFKEKKNYTSISLFDELKSIFRDLNKDIPRKHLTVNIGISKYPEDGNDFESLFRNSETALHNSKLCEKKRDFNVQFYSKEMSQKMLDYLEKDFNLKEALKNHEFELYYQPQIDLLNHKIIGLESLVRWKKNGKFISPAEFIPLAEENGLIVPLGYEILDMAIRQVALWDRMNFKVGVTAVNISMRQLKEIDFIEKLLSKLDKYNCDPSLICIEITESFIMDNPEQAIKILKDLRKLGITLAIDDFGTGYSSLAYLKKLPINKLKIDKTFIDNLVTDKEDQIVVSAIVSLAKNFNLSLIAEGIETKEQEDFINKLGCEEYQGYLFSKPLSVKDLEDKYFIKYRG